VSVALSSVASALDYSARPKVVLSELDFPTVAYQWRVKPGVEEVLVPSQDRIRVASEAYEAAIDDRTAAAVVSQVAYTSGAIADVARVAEAARSAGATSIVDAYHATGQLPTDVHALGVDVLVTGGLKWLLGGTGIALLYVRRDRIAGLRPTIAGWFGNAHQLDFDPRTFAFHDDARRFELGTPAVAAAYAGRAGIDLVLEVGVERLRARNTTLVNDLADRAQDAGFEIKIPPRPEDRAGIVMIRSGDAGGAVRRLAREGILVDHRHDRIRVSPFFYNTPEDHVRLIDALRSFPR
jgi:selenocysteine lyase/cysteine desulfurase